MSRYLLLWSISYQTVDKGRRERGYLVISNNLQAPQSERNKGKYGMQNETQSDGLKLDPSVLHYSAKAGEILFYHYIQG